MVIEKLLKRSGLLVSMALISPWITPWICVAQSPVPLVRGTETGPSLEFVDGVVWVKNIDQEVLYTFTRYYNTQEDWQSIFPVRVKNSQESISITGTYHVYPTSISFTPRFEFRAGTNYHATFLTDQLANNFNEIYLPKINAEMLQLDFQIYSKTNVAPVVTSIYPTSSVLPENTLKFHIVFSTSMTFGEMYDKVKLLDAAGREVEKPFLIIDQELWDEDMKVATILLDPGRIKRGLKGNVEMSTALKQGEKFTLIIDRGWKNIQGDPISTQIRKEFTCTLSDRSLPTIENWELIAPPSDVDPLVIKLKESYDFILLSNAIRITDPRGNQIEGKVIITDEESVLSFYPKNKWANETFTLNVNPLLEDLAGNNFKKPFDHDVASRDNPAKSPLTSLTFSVKSQPR